jgi:signal transduction histidine kinase
VPQSIRTRILAAFVLALISLTSTLVYGIHQMQAIGQELEAVNEGLLPMSKVGVELRALVRQLDRDHDRFARSGSQADASRKANAALYRASIQETLENGISSVKQARERIRNPQDRDAVDRVETVLKELQHQTEGYAIAVNHWFTVSASGDTEATGKLLADLDRRRQALASGAALTQALVEGQIERVSHRTASAQRNALFISISLGILSLVLSAALAGVALMALRPIGQLIAQVQRVAAGDFTGRVELQSKDEMGLLADEFNAMASAVSDRDQRLMERARSFEDLQNRLRQVVDTISSGLVVIVAGRIETLNPAAESLWSVQHGEPAPPWMDPLETGHHDRVNIDGTLYSITAVPFGQSGTLLIGEDVTEREAVRERLMRSERLAIVGRMLAQITHEVRNPLNAMSLNAELLGDEVATEDAQAMLNTITGEVRRLENLTERYLDLSKKRVVELSHQDPQALVEEIVSIERKVLDQNGLQVTISAPSATTFNFDADAIGRAIRNLIRNAAEAGSREMNIRIQASTHRLEFIVTDDGPGLTDQQSQKAFDPFFTTKSRGTGLGLAISRQEIEEIGGKLDHDGSFKSGAKFIISIPINA